MTDAARSRPDRPRRRRHRRPHVPGRGAGRRAAARAASALALVTDRRGEAFGGALAAARTSIASAPASVGTRRRLARRARGAVELALGALPGARACWRALKPGRRRRLRRLPLGAARCWRRQPRRHADRAARAERRARPRQPAARPARRRASRPPSPTSRGSSRRDARQAGADRQSGAAGDRRAARPALPSAGDDGADRLLVIGGSQGARVFSDVVPAALARAARRRCARRLRGHPAVPRRGLERRAPAYRRQPASPPSSRTFFADVPRAAGRRASGRSAAPAPRPSPSSPPPGRPALLVPYPHATDDHQTANARPSPMPARAWLMPQAGVHAAERWPTRLDGCCSTRAALTHGALAPRSPRRPARRRARGWPTWSTAHDPRQRRRTASAEQAAA